MSKSILKIIDDENKFQERVDELVGNTTYDQIKEAVATIKRTLKDYKDAVALCAPQVGINLRLFMVKTADGTMKVFLNPMIVSSEGLHLSREVSSSWPNRQFIIPRKNKIHVAYQEIDGRPNSESYEGVYAEVIQQMVEMLHGIILSDYGLEIDEDFDKTTKKNQQAIIQMYLEYLKDNYSGLKEEIEKNPDLKSINDNIDFMSKLLSGEIKPVDENGNIVDLQNAKKDEN